MTKSVVRLCTLLMAFCLVIDQAGSFAFYPKPGVTRFCRQGFFAAEALAGRSLETGAMVTQERAEQMEEQAALVRTGLSRRGFLEAVGLGAGAAITLAAVPALGQGPQTAITGQVVGQVVEHLTGLLGQNTNAAAAALAAIGQPAYWARQAGFTPASAPQAVSLVNDMRRRVTERAQAVGIPFETIPPLQMVFFLRHQLLAATFMAGLQAAPTPGARLGILMRRYIPLIFEEHRAVTQMLESAPARGGRPAAPPVPTGLLIGAPLLAAAAAVSPEAVRTIQEMLTQLSRAYRPGPITSGRLDSSSLFAINRLSFGQGYSMRGTIMDLPSGRQSIGYALYQFPAANLRARRMGELTGQFARAKKISELIDPLAGNREMVTIAYEVPGLPYHYLIDDRASQNTAQSLWAIKNSPSGQALPGGYFSVKDPAMRTIISHAFPQSTLAAVQDAADEQLVLHEMLHGWFRLKALFFPKREPAVGFFKLANNQRLAEDMTSEYAAYLGAMATGGHAAFHLVEWVTRLHAKNATPETLNVVISRLYGDLLARLPPQITGGNGYLFGEGVIIDQEQGLEILRKIVASADMDTLDRVLARSARDLYESSFGALPERPAPGAAPAAPTVPEKKAQAGAFFGIIGMIAGTEQPNRRDLFKRTGLFGTAFAMASAATELVAQQRVPAGPPPSPHGYQNVAQERNLRQYVFAMKGLSTGAPVAGQARALAQATAPTLNDPEWTSRLNKFLADIEDHLKRRPAVLTEPWWNRHVELIQNINDQLLVDRGWMLAPTDDKQLFEFVKILQTQWGTATHVAADGRRTRFAVPIPIYYGETMVTLRGQKDPLTGGNYFGAPGRPTVLENFKTFQDYASLFGQAVDPASDLSQNMIKDGLGWIQKLYNPAMEKDNGLVAGKPTDTFLRDFLFASLVHEVTHALNAGAGLALLQQDEAFAHLGTLLDRTPFTSLITKIISGAALQMREARRLRKPPYDPAHPYPQSYFILAAVELAQAAGRTDLIPDLLKYQEAALQKLADDLMKRTRAQLQGLATTARRHVGARLPVQGRVELTVSATKPVAENRGAPGAHHPHEAALLAGA